MSDLSNASLIVGFKNQSSLFLGIITTPFKLGVSIIKKTWNVGAFLIGTVKDSAKGVFNFLTSPFSGAIDYIKNKKNTQIKAPFILEKLKQNDAVVWTDADSRIRQYPAFFDTIETDVAFFFNPIKPQLPRAHILFR